MATSGGQPGNQNAAKTKPFWSAVNRAIAAQNGKQLRDAAEQLLNQAAKGEAWAIRELADRLDGKAHQSVDLSNPDGSALFSVIERVIIEPKK